MNKAFTVFEASVINNIFILGWNIPCGVTHVFTDII